MLQETSCPIHISMLVRLYQNDELSTGQIQTKIVEIVGYKPSQRTILRWLRLSGVAIRSASDEAKIRNRRPEVKQMQRERGRLLGPFGRRGSDPIACAKMAEKGRAVYSAMCRGKRIEVECARDGCTNSMLLKPSRVRRSLTNFCSASCRSKHYNELGVSGCGKPDMKELWKFIKRNRLEPTGDVA